MMLHSTTQVLAIQSWCRVHASSCFIKLLGCRAEKEAEKEKAKQEKEAARKEKEVDSGKHRALQLTTINGFRFQWCLVCGPAAL